MNTQTLRARSEIAAWLAAHNIPDYSPWGLIDTLEIRDGAPPLVFVSTPSHGGFYLPHG